MNPSQVSLLLGFIVEPFVFSDAKYRSQSARGIVPNIFNISFFHSYHLISTRHSFQARLREETC